jgi:hypothetical protein
MLQTKYAYAADEAVIQLDRDSRRALACVLADWLNIYAGVPSSAIRREHFETAVEMRRLLLSPDEPVNK